MRVMFDANNFGATSPRYLVDALEERGIFARIILHEGSQYRPKPDDIVINWGCAPDRNWVPPHRLNERRNVMLAVDKLDAFRKFKEAGVRIPAFTEDYNEALKWSAEKRVVGRSLLRSFEGQGIVVTAAGTPPAKSDHKGRRVLLWTKYIPKKEEYRVHVFNGEAIDIAQKRRRAGAKVNNEVRSWRNGWIFARENINPPEGLREIGVAAVKALGLNFGAVDVVWNEKKNRCYVLEVNTAPAIQETTVERYADAIAKYVRKYAANRR
jgi:glutathione synthase/RimK-type ligase-like ATP-grasp enzyme